MRKLDNLLPFLLIFIFIIIVLVQMTSDAATFESRDGSRLIAGQTITVSPICSFKIKTSRKSRLAHLVPYGVYRLVGQKDGVHYRNAFLQHKVGLDWRTIGETQVGSKFSVNVRDSRDSLLLYLRENNGSCALEGSLHGWGA